MSKSPVIKEGATPITLTCDKIKTNTSGGGTQNWLPEDEVNLGTKHITKDGTYKASNDSLYGYSEVTVSGIGKAVGKDPVTGEDKLVEPDPETGELEETVLPASIMVTTPPTKTAYTQGDNIDFSGIVVTMFNKAHESMGSVPFNELTFVPTVASGDVNPPSGEATLSDVHSASYSWIQSGQYWPNIIVWNAYGPLRVTFDAAALNAQTASPITLQYNQAHNYWVGNIDINGSSSTPDFGPATNTPVDDLVPYNSGGVGSNTITVKWPRPGDGLVLTATFDITVTSSGDS